MASILLHFPALLTTSRLKCQRLPPSAPRVHFSSFQHKPIVTNSQSLLSFLTLFHPGNPPFPVTRASSDDFLETIEKDKSLSLSEEKPVKFLFWVLLWASLSLGLHALSGYARAAAIGGADSIRASGFGVKVANALRSSGWPDEAVVFALATLPVIELRGAIPVGYWLQLKPVMLTVLSILGLVSYIYFLRRIVNIFSPSIYLYLCLVFKCQPSICLTLRIIGLMVQSLITNISRSGHFNTLLTLIPTIGAVRTNVVFQRI